MANSYRVVYGETIPAWEHIFPTMRAAKAFAKEHKSLGDVIFSIKKVVPGEAPQSITAAIEALCLTKTQIDALRRIRDHGPYAWCKGRGRAGGAVSRMFDRLADKEFCTRAPHEITAKGLAALIATDHAEHV
jgi:hypothetical protein